MSEIIARLIPGGVRYESVSRSTSNSAVSATDVAAALSIARLSPLEYHYARAKYALDEQAKIELFKCLVSVVKRKWGGARAEALVYLTITRNVDSNRCKKCGGTGHNRLARACAKCGGTGVYVTRNAENARAMGISRQAYDRTWASRVAEMDEIMSMADLLVRAGVGRALRDDDGT